jgi:hypothetical protein
VHGFETHHVRVKPWAHMLLTEHVINELGEFCSAEVARPFGSGDFHRLYSSQIVIGMPKGECPMRSTSTHQCIDVMRVHEWHERFRNAWRNAAIHLHACRSLPMNPREIIEQIVLRGKGLAAAFWLYGQTGSARLAKQVILGIAAAD